MAVEVFKLFGSIFVNNEEANKSIAKTDSKAAGVATTLGNGVKKAAKWGAAIVGAASSAAGGMLKMAESSASTADHIDKMSQKIGVSRQAYQELDFICSQTGTSVDNLQNGMKNLRSAMSNDKNAEIFNELGVAVADAEGNLRSSEDVMWDVMNSLQNVADADEKAALAQKLFGKSGLELMPLLNGQAGSIDEMKQKAHELGLVMSDELIDSGVGLTDSLDQTKRAFSAIITQLGASFMPIIKKVSDKLQDALPFIQQAIQKLAPVMDSFLENILPPLFELGETLFPILMDAFEQLLPVFQELCNTLLPIIVSILEELAPVFSEFISSLLPLIVDFLRQIAPVIAQFAQTILPLIVQLIQLLLPFLVKICELILPVLAEMISKILPLFGQIISEVLPILIDLLGKILPPILKVVESILPTFMQLFESTLPLIQMLTDTLLPVLLDLFNLLSPVLETLTSLFGDGLGAAIGGVTEILQPFLDLLGSVITFITDVFSGNWENAWNGIVNIFKSILNLIPAAFEGILNGAIWLINKVIDGLSWFISWTGYSIPHIPDVTLPRFRAGLDFVPSDDYPVSLDYGEAVLTADEAEEYRKAKRENGTGSPFSDEKEEKSQPKQVYQTFNITVQVQKINDKYDVAELAAQLSELLAEEVRETEGVYA